MVQEEQKKQEKSVSKKHRKAFRGPLLTMMVVAAIIVLGYKLWENPQLFYQIRDSLQQQKQTEDVYQKQIDLLNGKLAELQERLASVAKKANNPDFSEMNKRIDAIEQINVNTIKSKADVETVLGIIGRMDSAEGRLNDLSKVTNDSALILTAAMLVKDAGQRGAPFVYEAEVLSELAEGHYKISKEVMRINEIAANGVPSVEDLQREFAKVYLTKYPEAEAEDVLSSENWKDRIYHQIHKVVQIKKTGEDKSIVKQELSLEDRAWNTVKDMMAKGDVYQALAIVKKPINENIAEDKVLAEWLKHAEAYRDFYDSVSRISANALAVMKVNFLKNK